MNRLVALILFSLLTLPDLFAQQGNEWINYAQVYVKIPVGKDGLYRVTYNSLQTAGFPVTSINAKKIQIYHRGVEQAIIVAGENDNTFNEVDFVEFYGNRNDGTSDKELYSTPQLQPHSFYNLYSDTTSYFLTVGSANGKRAEYYQENNSGLATEQFHFDEKLVLLTNDYSSGKDYGQVSATVFDEGEGWMSPLILYNQPATSFSITGVSKEVTSGGNPSLEILITGRGGQEHPVDIFVGASSRLLTSIKVIGYQSIKVIQPVEWSDIGSGELKVSVKVNGTGTRVSVNYIKLNYAQEFDMAGGEVYIFNLPINVSGKSYIEIKNPVANTRLFDVTEPGSIKEIGVQQNTIIKAVIRNSNIARKLLASASVITPKLVLTNFRNINARSHNYIIISHASLRKPGLGYSDPVKAFAGYRASIPGGKYDTLIVNVDQLYDQFNYGEQSPLAIFHFMRFLAATNLPRYLFIIGKGLDVNYNYFRNQNQLIQYKSLIPTAGLPGSDIAFTAGLAGTTYDPAVATGRITAMQPQEVAAYLNKVIETEARPFNDLRRKNILHLSGGINAGEPQLFRSYLEEYAPIAEQFYLGGNVKAIAKQSTDLKLINIAEEVNNGLNLVTFFGHSSPGTLDFDIGYVTDPIMGYNNKGKYPTLLMNGCSAGSFFLNGKIFGEDWINAPDKGAIGFIAHSSLGFAFQLRRFSNLFYEVGFGDSTFITKGLGDIQKEVSKRFLKNIAASPIDITQVQQMILLGDPAVSLFGARQADFAVEDENVSMVSLNDEPVTAASDSFAISFIVRNFGQAKEEPLKIEIVRTLSDRSIVTYDSVYAPVLYSDTLLFILKGKNLKGFGTNTFEVRVDSDNSINELKEDNNSAYLDFFISLNSTQNLYPRKFSIVNTKEVSLSFQHSDVLSGQREFVVEIDTINSFNSNYKKTFTVNATVLARQAVTLLAQDTLVYYWRTKLAQPIDNENKDWVTSSFTYINNGPDGWAQVHFPQFLDNVSIGLVKDSNIRKLKFEETKTSLALRTFSATAGKPADSVSFKINSAEYHLTSQGFGCRNNTINLVAFDRKSTIPYAGLQFQWFNRAGRACGRDPWVINSFTSSELVTGNGDDIIQYVDNIISGDSVVLFSIGNAEFDTWSLAAKTKLGELGISTSQIESLQPGEAVFLFGRKGLIPGTAKIFRNANGSSDTQALKVDKTITGRYISGEMRSVTIGPALSWQKVITQTLEVEPVDQVNIDIIGISKAGEEVLLYNDVSKVTDISTIDALQYPNLRLIYKTSDDVNLTASQLSKWIVIYEPVTEGLIFYKGIREQETLQEGETWKGDYGFVNVSNKNFPGKLVVFYKVFNHITVSAIQGTIDIQAPMPGDTTIFTIAVNTFKRIGLNDIEVNVNPKIYAEQYYENNLFTLSKHLNVVGENFKPVLDVSIDGRYIDKDEFVSSSPKILVRLWDENKYLIKKDTTGINVFLAYACDGDECQFQRINFSQDNVQWFPATDTSDFILKYNPVDFEDGKYTLRIEARDQTGNVSGAEPYEISFRVKGEITLSISDPYPNPTKGEANFKIIYTGENLPDEFKIVIISLNGSMVQQIDNQNVNSLHIGTNTIQWSGKDSGGKPLPGGIYIYRVLIKADGKLFEKRGKISLLR